MYRFTEISLDIKNILSIIRGIIQWDKYLSPFILTAISNNNYRLRNVSWLFIYYES